MFGFRQFVVKRSLLLFNSLCGNSCKPVFRAVSSHKDAQLPVSHAVQETNSQLKIKQDAVSFNDTRSAYRSKTTREILRALLVLKLCSVNFLVDNNLKVPCNSIFCNVLNLHCPTLFSQYSKIDILFISKYLAFTSNSKRAAIGLLLLIKRRLLTH